MTGAALPGRRGPPHYPGDRGSRRAGSRSRPGRRGPAARRARRRPRQHRHRGGPPRRPVAMAARIGRDSFGAAFPQRLAASGVDTRYLVATTQPSALALATVDGDGEAQYDFWLAGAADFGWRAARAARAARRAAPSTSARWPRSCRPARTRWNAGRCATATGARSASTRTCASVALARPDSWSGWSGSSSWPT